MHSYALGGQAFPVDLKGRAWITSDKFQIVRIEADMVKSMPEIQLLSEHQTVEYGPVPFPKKNTTLWLPKTAEIYFDFRKHRLVSSEGIKDGRHVIATIAAPRQSSVPTEI